MIWQWTLVLAVAPVAAWFGWHLWSSRANRGRAIQILHWIEMALGGSGHVSGIRWLSSTEFEVPLRLASNIFNRANVRVKFRRSHIPLLSALSAIFSRRNEVSNTEPETFTFRADFDYKPAFNLEMNNLRWFARSRKDNNLNSPSWTFEGVQPVVLTTRLDWERESTTAFQSMLGIQQREDMQVAFRKNSPHFCATMPLEKITPESDVDVFEVLHSIAMSSVAKAS